MDVWVCMCIVCMCSFIFDVFRLLFHFYSMGSQCRARIVKFTIQRMHSMFFLLYFRCYYRLNFALDLCVLLAIHNIVSGCGCFANASVWLLYVYRAVINDLDQGRTCAHCNLCVCTCSVSKTTAIFHVGDGFLCLFFLYSFIICGYLLLLLLLFNSVAVYYPVRKIYKIYTANMNTIHRMWHWHFVIFLYIQKKAQKIYLRIHFYWQKKSKLLNLFRFYWNYFITIASCILIARCIACCFFGVIYIIGNCHNFR